MAKSNDIKKIIVFIFMLVFVGSLYGCKKNSTDIQINTIEPNQFIWSWISVYPREWIPYRASNFQSDMKLIWLQNNISYESLSESGDRSMNIVWYDSKKSIERESWRAVLENDLIEQEYIKSLLDKKLQDDRLYLWKLWSWNNDIEQLINKVNAGKVFSYYKKTEQLEDNMYYIQLWVWEDTVILDIRSTKITEDKTNNTWLSVLNSKLSLVPSWSNDFCEKLVIQDEKWNKIETMKEVEKALSWCDNESISISPNNKFLFLNYMDPPEKMTEYMIYNFETETLISAWYEDISVEWMRCIWNDNNINIACAMVDQNNYPWLTKTMIFTIDEYWFTTDAQEFMQEPWKSMAFVCWGSCYLETFKFIGDKTLEYNGHELIAPGEKFTISYN